MKAKTSRILGFMLLVMLVFAIFVSIWNAQQERGPLDDEISLLRRVAEVDDQKLADVLDHSLVPIPAGYFLRGSNDGNSNEFPSHRVYLNGFEIDRYEVTNSQYARFIASTGRKAPVYWNGVNYPAGQADFPVVGVSWDDANAYCAWAGKRLPTEAEWEKACRGPDGRQYPWGNDWDPGRANVGIVEYGPPPTSQTGSPTAWAYAWQLLKSTPAEGDLGLRPVGSSPDGASPYGVLDLVGNASEWVFDWYNWGDYSDIPVENPVSLGPPWNHCVRGSAWHDPAGDASWVQTMSRCPARNSAHSISDPRIGFRCARSVLAGEK